MKKLVISLLAVVLLIGGCSYLKHNTIPGFYYLQSKYPECSRCTSQTDFIDCIQEIDKKEGKAR